MKLPRKTYAFIDSQNLNLGVQSQGWRLDFSKFYIYLKDKFRISKAYLFIGYIPKNKKLYKMLQDFGYELVFKPTVEDRKGTVKGNVDAELVLYSSAIEFGNYNKAVVVSGDGDFYCLYEFLEKQNKLKAIVVPNKKSASSLLKRFKKYQILLTREKQKVEYKDGRRSALPRKQAVVSPS